MLVGEKYKKYIRDVKVIPWELQHRLVVVDLVKKVLKKVVRKQRIIRRKIWKLNENRTRVRFEKRVKELVSTDALDLWKTFKDGVLKACDEVCIRSLGKIEETCGGGMKRSRMVETDVVEGPVEKVARNEIVEAMKKMKSGKAAGTSEISVEMIVASGEIGVKVMMDLCQLVLNACIELNAGEVEN